MKEENRQALLAGQELLRVARRTKRVISAKSIGSKSSKPWPGRDRHWAEPSPEDLARRPAAYRCPVCGHEFAYAWDGLARTWCATHRDRCEECDRRAFVEAALEEARAATLHRYGLDAGRYAEMTLETYRADPAYPSQALAKEAVRRLVDTWARGDWSAGILLCSPDVGIGKTHLAIAAAREGVMRYQPRAGERLLAVWDMPSLLGAVRQSYEDSSADPIAGAQEPAILVLDDLGIEHVTANGRRWYLDTLFQVINARWLAKRATIVTTNLDKRSLWEWTGKRVYSRMLHLTGPPVEMQGRDHRLRSLSAPGGRL